MKKKLCCILTLIVLILNSSIMLIVSEAVDAIQSQIGDASESKINALAEINLTKYENFDTTTENIDTGSKGVLVQFNLKTGIEFLDGEKFNYIDVNENDFVIFYPNDVHAPMLSVKEDVEIKKVIVKIKI